VVFLLGKIGLTLLGFCGMMNVVIVKNHYLIVKLQRKKMTTSSQNDPSIEELTKQLLQQEIANQQSKFESEEKINKNSIFFGNLINSVVSIIVLTLTVFWIQFLIDVVQKFSPTLTNLGIAGTIGLVSTILIYINNFVFTDMFSKSKAEVKDLLFGVSLDIKGINSSLESQTKLMQELRQDSTKIQDKISVLPVIQERLDNLIKTVEKIEKKVSQ
jgi:hypothetical protein